MSPDPRVSVPIPMYNGADHISDRTDSVLQQTFHDFELVPQSPAGNSAVGHSDLIEAKRCDEPAERRVVALEQSPSRRRLLPILR